MFDRLTFGEELPQRLWENRFLCEYGQSLHIDEIADVEGERDICASLYFEALRNDA